jgi:hypothetical protein
MANIYNYNKDSNLEDLTNPGWYQVRKNDKSNLALRVGDTNLEMPGEIRFNSSLQCFQGFNGSEWINFRDNIDLNKQLNLQGKLDDASIKLSVIEAKYQQLLASSEKLLDQLNQEIKKNRDLSIELKERKNIKMEYLVKSDITIEKGQIVILTREGEKIVIAPYHNEVMRNGVNPFGNTASNIFGVAEYSRKGGELCPVITQGIGYVKWNNSIATEYSRVPDPKIGVMGIVDTEGGVYRTSRKPNNDFISIGYFLSDKVDVIEGKELVLMDISPKIHFL